MTLLLALAGCSTLATLHGARTLDPGEIEAGVALSVQHASNPVSTALPLFPQLELAARYGVSRDVDVGARVYLLGGGADVRYRFLARDGLDLAVAPGLDLFAFPTLGGSAQVRAPVLGEVQLARWCSIGGGPALLLRDQWNRVKVGPESGLQSRVDVFAGGGARWEVRGGPIVFGVSGDLYAQPARAAGPAWSAGVDLALRDRQHVRTTPPVEPSAGAQTKKRPDERAE